MVSLIVMTFLVFLALTAPAGAQYTYRTVDIPCLGCGFTVMTGLLSDGTRVGNYTDAANHDTGFVWPRQAAFQPLPFLTVQEVNQHGALTGSFVDPQTQTIVAFVFANGTRQDLVVPREDPRGPYRTLLTEASALNDAGQVVGAFRSGLDGIGRGFVYDPALPREQRYTRIEVPNAQSTAALAISSSGVVLVRAVGWDTVTRHYLWAQGVLTALVVPALDGVPEVDLVGRLETGPWAGLIAGNAGEVGFVTDGTLLEEIAYPGALLTDLFGVRQDGTVYGRYIDATGVHHGFVANRTGGRLVAQQSTKMHTPMQASDCGSGSKRAACVQVRRGRD